MVNYENGKIYKIEPICDHEENEIYIGSTTKQYLSQRMDCHRSNFKCFKKGIYPFVTIFKLFDKYGLENCEILLLENVNATSKDELRTRETYYIKTLNCVNKRIEGRSRKEYYIDNKEKEAEQCREYYKNNKANILEYQKQYYNNNKEQIQLKNHEQIICPICNGKHTKHHRLRHAKSMKHIKALENQNNLIF